MYAGLHAECVGRTRHEPTIPDDIVLAIMTTQKRHGLIEMLRETWLKDAKALLLTDAPGLAETPQQRVRIWRGHPDCGAADRGGPTIHFANTSFWPDYKWLLHVDDDVLVHTPNLARFLSAFDPDLPLWFSAHGCDPSYVPMGKMTPPCVAQHAPRGCLACNGRLGGLRDGLRSACRSVRSDFVPRRDVAVQQSKTRKAWRGECAALPAQQGLKTFGSEVGQSYCGGTGCVFSRGWLRSFPAPELFRNRTQCQGCTRGQQDVSLSGCLFHHNPAAIAPIGIPGFFGGRAGERLIEQMLHYYPECAEDAAILMRSGEPHEYSPRQRADLRLLEATCVRRHGLMEWFTLHLQVHTASHLQVRGAFTTLYRNLTPAVWHSSFRHHERGVPVPKLLQQTYALATRTEPAAGAQQPQWAARLCCGLLRRNIVPCNLGCTPWRMISLYAAAQQNASDARQLAPADAAACAAADHEPNPPGGGAEVRMWEQPAPRGAESELLHPDQRQTWRNGAMKCDLCEGFFDGWREL